MRKRAILSLLIAGALVASAQGPAKMAQHKLRQENKPECSQGAVCFSGRVEEGHEFRKELNADLEFVLRLPGGLDVVSRHPSEDTCKLSLWIANPPLMAHNQTEIEAGYGWTAEDDVGDSPREFLTVENCEQFQTLYDLVYDRSKADIYKYGDYIRTLKGHGRLWITGSKLSHSSGDENGTIDWMTFSVEIRHSSPN